MAHKVWSMVDARWVAGAVAAVMSISACGSSPDSTTTNDTTTDGSTTAEATIAVPVSLPLRIENQGGSMEGHTPRGFAGSGTGLFAGDNLNPGFPDGDGVQLWLTFDLPESTPTPTQVVLRAETAAVSGTPFADLGALLAEPVSYDVFGPELFDLPSTGTASICSQVSEGGIECDVSSAVAGVIATGDARAQFRLRFETIGDNDGTADLALFFLTDSNTNEPGIFTLNLS